MKSFQYQFLGVVALLFCLFTLITHNDIIILLSFLYFRLRIYGQCEFIQEYNASLTMKGVSLMRESISVLSKVLRDYQCKSTLNYSHGLGLFRPSRECES